MKLFVKAIVVINLIFFLLSCQDDKKNQRKNNSNTLYWLYVLSLYSTKNYCPPKNATLDSGTYTITLNAGEEYWFDIKNHSYNTIAIGVSKSSTDQTFTFYNGNCLRNESSAKTQETFSATEDWKVWYTDNEFSYYDFYFSPTSDAYYLGAIKMASGSGNIVLKIP
ncbi:MAG: hypothetical protein H7A23_20960 [Leptospiraceae bacterium]|nr:hypothetical protein [Leptospiraceae bacterium]MCP5497033.1 hypothetical protein [Leptospiraceae bacterium]